jgi:hypothetical protein
LLFEGQRQFGTVAPLLKGGSGPQRGIEGQVGDFVFGGDTGPDVVTPFAFGFGLGAAAGLFTGQAVKLGIQTAGGKFLFGLDFLAAFPPMTVLGGLGNGLGAGFGLANVGPFFGFRV